MNEVCEREQDKIKKAAMPMGTDRSTKCDRGELIKPTDRSTKCDRGELIKPTDRSTKCDRGELIKPTDRSTKCDRGELIKQTAGSAQHDPGSKKGRTSKDPYNSTRWYNEVFSDIYREASGQPVLTGGREYGAARTYFVRLKELNPMLGPKEIFERATHGACFMLESQSRGGVFGWMHCPPDICMLSSQAQAVDYHLRKTVIVDTGAQKSSKAKQAKTPAKRELREKEAQYASEEITRIYGELRGMGRARG